MKGNLRHALLRLLSQCRNNLLASSNSRPDSSIHISPPDWRHLGADEMNASKRLTNVISRFAGQNPRSHNRSWTSSCPLVLGPVFLDDVDRLRDMVNSFTKGSTELAKHSLLPFLGRQLGPLSAWIAGVEAGDTVLSVRSDTGIACEADGAVGGAVLAREVGGMPPRLLKHEHCL